MKDLMNTRRGYQEENLFNWHSGRLDWKFRIGEDKDRISDYADFTSERAGLDISSSRGSTIKLEDLTNFGELCCERDKGTLDLRFKLSGERISELIRKVSNDGRNVLTLSELCELDFHRCEHLQSLARIKAVEFVESEDISQDPLFEFMYLYNRLRDVCGREASHKQFLYHLYFRDNCFVYRIVKNIAPNLGIDLYGNNQIDFERRMKLMPEDIPYRRAMKITDLSSVLK